MNAYSEDLRKKIVEALRRGASKSEAARTFGVSLSSVKRYAKLTEEGRLLASKKRPGRWETSTRTRASFSPESVISPCVPGL